VFILHLNKCLTEPPLLPTLHFWLAAFLFWRSFALQVFQFYHFKLVFTALFQADDTGFGARALVSISSEEC